MEEKIFDGQDRAHAYGFINFEAFLRGYPNKQRGFGGKIVLKAWNGKTGTHPELRAHISGGRWSVQCWCRAYSYVTHTHPIHWCMVCGNEIAGNVAVPVIFPEETERKEIEQLLLARPMQPGASEDELAASREALPLVPGLYRDWYPGQSVEFLAQLNRENGIGA
jgi:hypothetical protein